MLYPTLELYTHIYSGSDATDLLDEQRDRGEEEWPGLPEEA